MTWIHRLLGFFLFFPISKQLIFWPGRAIHRCGGWQRDDGFRLSALITASWGLLGGISTLREAGSFPIYLQVNGKSLAAHASIQQEQLVTDCTFRGTVGRRAGQGEGSSPTQSEWCFLQSPRCLFLFRGEKNKRLDGETGILWQGENLNSWLSLAPHFKRERWGKWIVLIITIMIIVI